MALIDLNSLFKRLTRFFIPIISLSHSHSTMVSLSPLSVLLFLFTLTHLSTSQNTTTKHYYLKLPLLHKTPPPSPSQSLLHDSLRLSHLPHLTSPIISGASDGEYIIPLHLGTPPQCLRLIADTGSDLIWTHCSTSTHRNDHNFFPRLSASYKNYHCFHPSCKQVNSSNSDCNNHSPLHTPCLFSYSYVDNSSFFGFFATETASFHSKHKHTNLTLSFGCASRGSTFNSAQGVMGLGRGNISFISQLGPRFGNKFSYCLKDKDDTLSPQPTSYLTFGGEAQNDNVVSNEMKFTPLVVNPNPDFQPFYYIGIKSVSVNGAKLRIDPSVWSIKANGDGGTFIDSGTTNTYLAKQAYHEVVTAIRRRVRELTVPSPTPGFELCVNESKLVKGASLPRLKFELVGNSVFSPPQENYFIKSETDERVKCLAILPANESGFLSSVIGNRMQQGFLLEFDIDRSRLGFSRHGCDP